jgi:DNA-binding MarR family transcriptional regulator
MGVLMRTGTGPLSANQVEILTEIGNHNGQFVYGSSVAAVLGRAPEGVHQTAASLRRRGLVDRSRALGAVSYAITDAGRAALDAS